MKYLIIILLFLSSCRSDIPEASLKIIDSYKIPLREISGMCWYKNKTQIAMIGDDSNEILLIDWPIQKEKLSLKRINIKGLSFDRGFESIASDDSGRLFLLHEDRSQVFITDRKLEKIEFSIKLKISKQMNKELRWDEKKNSGPEGITLLRNGNILIAKEKKPQRLVEFSRGQSSAFGYETKLSLENGGVFPVENLDSENTYYSVSAWKKDKGFKNLFKDVSGININKDNRLFLLSDKNHMIVDIGNSLKVNNSKVQIKKVFKLPSDFKKAEGMVIDNNNNVIIGVDTKSSTIDNLFVLTPLI